MTLLTYFALWALLSLALASYALAIDTLLSMVQRSIRRRRLYRRLSEVCNNV